MLVFGGRKNAKRYFNDVFALRRDASGAYAWESLDSGSDSSAPSKRNHHAAAAVNGSMLVFGGRTSHGYAVASIKSDLWSFDVASSAWTEIGWDDGSKLWPMGRFEHTMEYAGNGQVVVMAGQGTNGDRRNDVWSYSAISKEWKEVSADDCSIPTSGSNRRVIYAVSGFICSVGAILLCLKCLVVTSTRRGYTSL